MTERKQKLKNAEGITLIALVITIIVLLILAGVSISMVIGNNGIITKTIESNRKMTLATIKEQIDLHAMGKLMQKETGINLYPVLSETMADIDTSGLSDNLKRKLLSLSNTAEEGEIPTFENIDYTQFYKLDVSKVPAGEEYMDLYLYSDSTGYKVISMEGIKVNGKIIYTLIPFDDIGEPQYIATANNTYKMYGDGTLKVLGQKTINSGMTLEEEAQISGIQEFDIYSINEQFNNRMSLPPKKLHFSTGTVYVIDQNNDLWAWGTNQHNKLGQGHSYLLSEPTKILEGRTGEISGVKAKGVWGGISNTFVLDTDNRLWGCGVNTEGILGQGNTNTYDNYVEIPVNGAIIKKINVSTTSSVSNAFIENTDGTILAAGKGTLGGFGLGNKINLNIFTLLPHLEDVKKIMNIGSIVYVLKNNGELYSCGYGTDGTLGTGNTNTITRFVKIKDNIKDVFGTCCIDEEGYLYQMYNTVVNKIDGFQDENATIISTRLVISNGKLYEIQVNSTSIIEYNQEYDISEGIQSAGVKMFKSDGKIYIDSLPDITNPRAFSNYRLKEVFNNVMFMQGKGSIINVIKKSGEIYENIREKVTLDVNAKKVISSTNARYVLTTDGHIYAKGHAYTGMWGEIVEKSDYQKITKNGIDAFDNVRDIFPASSNYGAIFITEDNNLYWAGCDAYVPLPGITGDISVGGSGNSTLYPKEVSSPKINEIKDKIKDIRFAYINAGGIRAGSILILTSDGKLYTYGKWGTYNLVNGLNKTLTDFEELIIKEGIAVKEIFTQDAFCLALLSNGEVYGWGYNTYGLLGQGYTVGEVYPIPVKLDLPDNISTMSVGNGFAVFASNTGEVYGIGRNDYGQLGTGNSIGADTFVRCLELEK